PVPGLLGGLIRREVAWAAFYEPYYQIIMIAGWVAGFATVLFAFNLVLTLLYGEKVPKTDIDLWAVQTIALERYGMRREGYKEEELPVALPADGMIRMEENSGTSIGTPVGTKSLQESVKLPSQTDLENHH
ncbi:MAG: cytochrome-c oxidase, partial [Metallosphaera sp.]